ncbi:hypothetical protein VFPPC_14935 [Pochonia chlamydosporia 170]|uniref:2EXR domain-containing protein n=1 Tax=Pochonia chlamydosporia 170 TaxID=1380566 RepID=A0A179EYQ9_METCM|nr:hypothetical protein VFPPC_14935 [Pochonia chlamydosporia 170]OAQ58140.1 hypothetical protein VFPPC_14935 [Pochonia chlamydosporia 170]
MATTPQPPPFNNENAFKELTRIIKDGFKSLEQMISQLDSNEHAERDNKATDSKAEPSEVTDQMDMAELSNIAISHVHEQPKPFRFNELPLELRLEIWKMAMPSKRIFEPWVMLRQPHARYQLNPEDPPLVKLKRKHPPPALRAVCHECRRASDMVGGFKFGRAGNRRQGCWFNYYNDIVFIDPNMMDNVHHMDLRCVSTLGFVHLEFKTE